MNASLPPKLPVATVLAFLRDVYRLDGVLAALDGERDQNFKFTTDVGTHVVKICNLAEGPAIAAAQVQALNHIAAVDPTLPTPRPRTPQGSGTLEGLAHDGHSYPVIVMNWLDGSVMGGRDCSASHYHTLGSMIGRLTKSLRGFSSAAFAARQLAWNTAQFQPTSDDWAVLPGSAQVEVPDIRANLRGLPSQIIHGDVHPFNTLLDGSGNISGIIDFGDMVHAPRVQDIANAMADCLLPGQDMEMVIRQMLAGYVTHTSLEEDEVEVILPLMRQRLLLTAIITARRRAEGAAVTPQIAALDSVSLEVLRALDGKQVRGAIRYGANLAPRGATPAQDMLLRRLHAMGPKPLLFYDDPLHMVRGAGVWLTASDGRHYLDCYNNVAHVGHANPHVAEAVARQLRVLNTNTRYLTDEAINYAERLKETLDPSLDTVIFVNSGSEANDVAYRMAKAWTGSSGMLIMDHAYHGVTDVSDSMSPSNYPPGKFDKSHIRQLEAPDTYRGPFRQGGNDLAENYAAFADTEIVALKDSGLGLALAIIDSAFMTNGIITAPAGYMQAIARKTRTAGGLFVADEVQSGFGRLGTHMWGHQQHGVVPDFVTIGKPAGNGYPIGAIITRAEILSRFVDETGPFFSTFGGGNAACAAGLAVLDVMEQEKLLENAHAVGEYFRLGLRSLMQGHHLIGDVRGSGLAIGVELVRDRSTVEPAATQARQVINALRQEGVLVGIDGKLGNVLKIRPPLIFGKDNADRVVTALGRVLAKWG